MATSGSTDFNLTRLEIITKALRIVGAIAQSQSPTADMLSQASITLNMFIKSLQTKGTKIWTRDWIQVDIQASSQVLGSDSNAYECIKSHTSAASTTPVTGSNYTTYWRPIANPGGLSAHALSTSYNFAGDFTLPSGYLGDLEKVFIRENNTDYPVRITTLNEYLDVWDKSDDGIPELVAIDESLTTITGYLYPVPDETDQVLHILAMKILEDMDSDSDEAYFPVRWLNVITFGLARDLSHEYGKNLEERAYLNATFESYLRDAMEENSEVSTLFVKSAYGV